jgi:hypothetical protein
VRAALISFLIALGRTLLLIGFHDMEWGLLRNMMYLPLYFFAILPLKALSLITCWKMSWSTAARVYGLGTVRCKTELAVMVACVVMWDAFVSFGIARTFFLLK